MRYFAMLLAALMALTGFSTTASAEAYHAFVDDEFYLGNGGTPATFEEVEANPTDVLSSDTAYRILRAHISSFEGYNLTDEDFRTLMRSDRVKLVPCIGIIDTAGVTDSGRVGYRPRQCYDGEMLIELTLRDGSRVVVASQGCYNPVRGMPIYPAPQPVRVIREAPTPPPQVVVEDKSYAAENPTSSVTDIDLPRMGGGILFILDLGQRHNADCPDGQHDH